MEAIDRLTQRLAPKGKLEHTYLNLTSLCNLKYFYCYDETYRAKKQEMLTLEEIQKIADDCKALRACSHHTKNVMKLNAFFAD